MTKKDGAPIGNKNAVKPPETHRRNVTFKLSPEVITRLKTYKGNRSRLVETLLIKYFERMNEMSLETHKDGHINQAGGCCCPECGNTCGYHPEWNRQSTLQMPALPNDENEEDQKAAEKNLARLIKKASRNRIK